MIGLKRGALKLTPHDKGWNGDYLKERERILEALKPFSLRIAHVGSTAIPGIHAKPVIDIALEVGGGESIESVCELLIGIGYEYFGDRRSNGDYFFACGSEDNRTHYLHVSLEKSKRFENYVRFRNALRNNHELAKQYDSLKSELIKRFPKDRESYTNAKSVFIQEVIKIPASRWS